ncbi:beta-lactamase/transpeptidase-like protein [Xylogone sp. PMI_703]|nr:beta-lactamase/transpeptidase-like protein [Xylogone sp. PMI_703]
MSRKWTPLLDGLTDTILEILKISRTELCSVLIGVKGETYASAFGFPDGGRPERITADEGERVFASFSLFKIFISTSVSLMIDKLSANPDPTNKFSRLHGVWTTTFTEIFNQHCENFHLRSLAGNPTVREIVHHFKGPCDINHLLLSPENSPILSKNAFLETISQYTRDTRQNIAQSEYSNANYILLALFIEAVSGQSLAEFLKQYIFDPLEMHHTYLSPEKLKAAPQAQRAQPHQVSSNGRRQVIRVEEGLFLADTVEISTMGCYISIKDIGKFLDMVIRGLNGTPVNSRFDQEFVESLFILKHGYSSLGLLTTTDGDLPGSHSLNRLISTQNESSESSKYVLGKTRDNKNIDAYYVAGCGTGWLHTIYLLPKQRTFIVVMTNTWGPLDTSDIVSRLYLQEMCDLIPAKIDDPTFSCSPERYGNGTEYQRYRAHYIWLANKMYQENSAVLRNFERSDFLLGTPTTDRPNATGIFANSRAKQRLHIFDLGGILGVRLEGDGKTSKNMRFVRTLKGFRMCSYPRGSLSLGIDCFGDWRNLEFGFEEDKGGNIARFTREGVNMVDIFTRVR